MDEIQERFLDAGMNAYIPKPLEIQDLDEKIKEPYYQYSQQHPKG